MISQGDVFWAALPEPTGSGPGCRLPVAPSGRRRPGRCVGGSCGWLKRWNMTRSAHARRAGLPPIFGTAMRGQAARSGYQVHTGRGVRDWRICAARGVCVGNLAGPSTSRRCASAWRRLGGRKIEQGESRSVSRVMFHAKVRSSGHVRPSDEGWALPVHHPFLASPEILFTCRPPNVRRPHHGSTAARTAWQAFRPAVGPADGNQRSMRTNTRPPSTIAS